MQRARSAQLSVQVLGAPQPPCHLAATGLAHRLRIGAGYLQPTSARPIGVLKNGRRLVHGTVAPAPPKSCQVTAS